MPVIDRDRGFSRIMKQARSLSLECAVGIQGVEASAERPDGTTNVGLAVIHEYGTPNNRPPERSFLRSTFDENSAKYQRTLDSIAQTNGSNSEVEGALMLLGESYRKDIIDKIHSHIPPPLAPVTVARKKGETTPLIDTGQLINSISVVVRERRRI